MPNELKGTLSIIPVSCMISTLYEYVGAVIAVAHTQITWRSFLLYI